MDKDKKALISQSVQKTSLGNKNKSLLELALEDEQQNRKQSETSEIETSQTGEMSLQVPEQKINKADSDRTDTGGSKRRNPAKSTQKNPDSSIHKPTEHTTTAESSPQAEEIQRKNYTFYLQSALMDQLERMIYWEGLRKKKQGASYIVEKLIQKFMSDKKEYPPIPESDFKLKF